VGLQSFGMLGLRIEIIHFAQSFATLASTLFQTLSEDSVAFDGSSTYLFLKLLLTRHEVSDNAFPPLDV